MRGIAISGLLLLLLGCSGAGPSEAPEPARAEAAPSPAPAPPPAQARAKPKLVEEKTGLLDFTYGWPAEAAAIPKLVARFEAEMTGHRAEAISHAEADKEARPPDTEFNGHYYSKVWSAEGSSGRLLSLAAAIETFSGGAHGNQAQDAIIWDREADAPIEVAALFSDPKKAFAEMTGRYCQALDQERAERREEELPLKGEGWMVECPALAEQVVVPTDENKDGRFELFRVLIPPYSAGPYVEGSYVVDLPLTSSLRALVKPEYGGAFAAPASTQPQ